MVPTTALLVIRLVPEVRVTPLKPVPLNAMSVSEKRNWLGPVVSRAAPALLLTMLRLILIVVDQTVEVDSTLTCLGIFGPLET